MNVLGSSVSLWLMLFKLMISASECVGYDREKL